MTIRQLLILRRDTAHIAILWTIGVILLIVGLVLMLLGRLGHAVGGRRHSF